MRCPRCGTSPWEWDDDPFAWTADHFTCHGCLQLDGYERELANSSGRKDGAKLGLFKTQREDSDG